MSKAGLGLGVHGFMGFGRLGKVSVGKTVR